MHKGKRERERACGREAGDTERQGNGRTKRANTSLELYATKVT